MDEKAILAICLIGILAFVAIIIVAINPPQNINKALNVHVVNLLNGQVLAWDSVSGNWTNVNATGGMPGPPGVNGTVWFTNSSAPSSGTGIDGDYFFNSLNGDVYQKVTGAWVLIGNLMGPTGATGAQGIQGIQGIQGNTGANGATWFSGSGVPSSGLGSSGDYYLDTVSGNVYKKNGSWSVIGNLMGPQGPKGDKGDKGDTGAQGTPGTQIDQAVNTTSSPTFANLNVGTNITAFNLYISHFIQGNRGDNNNLYLQPKADAGNIIFRNPTGLDLCFDFLMSASTPTITFLGDTNLYRASAGVLKTDNNFQAANFVTSGLVDGVDISTLLLKTTKVADLGSIWDKTTKIAYGDTSFSDQSLLSSSSPTFAAITLHSSDNQINIFGDLARIRMLPNNIAIGSAGQWYLGPQSDLNFYITGYDGANFNNALKLDINGNAVILGTLQTGGYKSSDGSTGATDDITVLTALPSTFTTLHFKNGLYVGHS